MHVVGILEFHSTAFDNPPMMAVVANDKALVGLPSLSSPDARISVDADALPSESMI